MEGKFLIKINTKFCKQCGICSALCPKQVFDKEVGKPPVAARADVCIGCKMCEKACQFDAVKVLDNVAHIDPEKCTGCGACAAKCPKKVIL